MNIQINYIIFNFALFIFLTSIFAIINRIKNGLLLSAISGLFLTVALFFGLGTICYLFFGYFYDRSKYFFITHAVENILPQMLYGIFLITIIDIFIISRFKKHYFYRITELKDLSSYKNLNRFNLTILICSFIASNLRFGSFAQSGVGTIIPVAANALYPICILIIYTFNRSPFSILNLLIMYFTLGINAFYSSWRSGLILLLTSIFIGITLRNKWYWVVLLIPLAISVLLFILPFQELKKKQTNLDKEQTTDLFNKNLLLTFDERLSIVGTFVAVRINYSREMGFVQNGIDSGQLEYRDGLTYWEALYQLIPRFLWSNKPVYNYFTGFEIPRKIQLLSRNDQYTSWAVNCFAEFIYNYSYMYLPLFITIIYFFLLSLDLLVKKLNLKKPYDYLLASTLFFLSLNLVSFIFSATYFLWSFICIIAIHKITKNKLK